VRGSIPDRDEQCRQAQHEQDVDQVGPDDVADGELTVAVVDGAEADRELRQAGPQRDDRQGR
jgi:hypothetical protein